MSVGRFFDTLLNMGLTHAIDTAILSERQRSFQRIQPSDKQRSYLWPIALAREQVLDLRVTTRLIV